MKPPPRRERSSMNMGTSTSFAEQEAAAMEKNREAFMALWNEYVKGRKGDKAVLRYLEEAGFFTSPASTKYHGAFPGGLCYHSVNVATEVLGIMAQHQLEDENMNASAVTCALLHDICKAGAYRDGGWLYGLKVRNPRRLPEPVPLEAMHLDYPPQSWRWLDSINADGLAEIAAAQGVKL